MKKSLLSVLMLLMLSMPIGVNALAPPPRAQTQGQALVISSLNETLPMGEYAKTLLHYLKHGGYNVTYLTDGAVTVDLMVNHMNDYSVVVWRTNTFKWVHATYWYIGEKSNQATEQKYASDFAAGWLNDNTGIIGMSSDFINNHFGLNTLTHVKLLILIASEGNSIAPSFIRTGISSVIFSHGAISLTFGLIDYLTVQMVSYLTQGEDVDSAVYDTISPFNQAQQPQDPLDSTYAAPFWYIGNGTLTIV